MGWPCYIENCTIMRHVIMRLKCNTILSTLSLSPSKIQWTLPMRTLSNSLRSLISACLYFTSYQQLSQLFIHIKVLVESLEKTRDQTPEPGSSIHNQYVYEYLATQYSVHTMTLRRIDKNLPNKFPKGYRFYKD